MIAPGDCLVTSLPDAHLAQLRATYYGMITEVDAAAFWSMVDSMVEGHDQPSASGVATR